MSWGIAETASELEKLKSESADYLNGLNSCGEIDYSTYSEAFDFYADLIEKAYRFAKDTNVLINDCISRQAAIDAVKSRKTAEQCKEGEVRNWTVDACVDMIKKMPSAQPKRTEERTETHACDLIDRQAAIPPTLYGYPVEHLGWRTKTNTADDYKRRIWNENCKSGFSEAEDDQKRMAETVKADTGGTLSEIRCGG